MSKEKKSKSKSDSTKLKKRAKKIISINLHKKHRPNVVEDYYGQPSIQKTMAGWVKTGNFPSTILIEGMTGAGKTTLARLIARYINCDTHSACGKCPNCKFGKNHPDYKEVDAGSDGNVEDVRTLVASSHYAPTFGNKRIIVVDESHLLSGKAASALLVPMEEPDADTIWILCTTNAEKMLKTIVNRCTTLSIRPIPPKDIEKRLGEIVKLEKIKVDDKKACKLALRQIAEFSEGQMRLAISQLQALLGAVSAGEKFSAETVLSSFAETSGAEYDKIASKLLVAMLCYEDFETVRIIQTSGDTRTLLGKMIWLVDWCIQYNCGVIKYQSYIGKQFLGTAKGLDKKPKKVFDNSYTLPNLINILDVLLKVQITLNSASVPEKQLFTAWAVKLIIKDYEFTLKD